MRISDLMDRLAAYWPKKFADKSGPWYEAYRAALGHAEGERLEAAWQRYIERGVDPRYAPSPKEIAELLPGVPRDMRPASGFPRDLKARREQERHEAHDWLMRWWKPLLDHAQAKATPELARSLRYHASSACNRRAPGVAAAWREGRQNLPEANLEHAQAAIWSAMRRYEIPTNRIPVADLPRDALGIWRAMHGGKANTQEAA